MRCALRACGVLLLTAATAAAQQTTGSLELRVRDESGKPVRGARIAARRQGGTEVSTCSTREDGSCLLRALAPGRYRVSVPGARPVVVEVVPGSRDLVWLDRRGGEGDRGVPPETGGFFESRALGRRELGSLPAGRGLMDALRLDRSQPSPGNAWLKGSSPGGVLLFIEGFEWPSGTPALAGPGVPSPWPASLAALRLEASGGGAVSARGADGAIDAVLRSGGATLSGEASVGYEASWLNGAPRPFSRYSPWDSNLVETGLTVPQTPFHAVTPAVSLGGRIGPSGPSFHAAASASRREHHRDVVFIADPERLSRSFSWFSTSAHATASLSASGERGRKARLAFVFGAARNRGSAPALEPDQGRLPDGSSTSGLTRASFDGPEEVAARWQQTGGDSRRATLTAAFDVHPARDWWFAASVGVSRSNSWTPPAFRGHAIRHVFATSNARIPGLPVADRRPSGYSDAASSYGTLRDASRRVLAEVEVTWAPGRRLVHQLSAGLRAERASDDVYIGHERPVIRLYWGRTLATASGEQATGPYGYYTVSRPGTIGRAAGSLIAAWWQDRWSPHERVTVDAGLRAEREAVPSYARGPDIRRLVFAFHEKLAPRLSAAWRPDAGGRWRAQAWFGIYHDQLKTQLTRALFGGRRDAREAWTLDTLDWQGLACDEGVRSCPGSFIERVDARPPWNAIDPGLSSWFGPTTRVDPGLRPMRTGEWGAGLERRMGRSSLAIRLTGKWLATAVEDVGLSLPGVGETSVLANPGYGYARLASPSWPAYPLPRAGRQYREVEFEFRRRSQRFALAARYRLSRLQGNYGGLASADEGGRQSTNRTEAFDSLFSSYDHEGRPVWGPLPGDRRHRADLEATLALPLGTSLSVAALVESGSPESSELRFRGARVLYNGLGDLGRQPAFSQVDVQLRKAFRAAGAEVVLEAAIDNLFDQATPLGFFSTSPYRDDLTLDESAFFDTPWDPAGWAARLRAQGAEVRDEKLFLVPNRFQRPRRGTLGASIRF